MAESVIYFIQCVDGGPIKIGYTGDITVRQVQLEEHYNKDLRVLATMPGGLEQEREVHSRFAHLRFGRTEQFRPTPELMAFIGLPLALNADFDVVQPMLPLEYQEHEFPEFLQPPSHSDWDSEHLDVLVTWSQECIAHLQNEQDQAHRAFFLARQRVKEVADDLDKQIKRLEELRLHRQRRGVPDLAIHGPIPNVPRPPLAATATTVRAASGRKVPKPSAMMEDGPQFPEQNGHTR